MLTTDILASILGFLREKLRSSNLPTMECLPKMTEKQLASLSELLSELCGPLSEGDYGMLDTADFYEKLRLRDDFDTERVRGYANLIYEYLRRSRSPMADKYERLASDLLTVRQRQFAIESLVARRELRKKQLGKSDLEGGIPWFPDVYKKVRRAYKRTKYDALKIVCLMVMGNVTEEGEDLVPVKEETGILRLEDLTSVKVGPKRHNDSQNERDEDESDKGESDKGESDEDECDEDESDEDECDEGYFDMSKLYIGKRELNMSEVFLSGVRELTKPRDGYLITGPSGENDRDTYGWLCSVFDRKVGFGIAEVRLSYFNWREMTGAGPIALAEICAREGYKAVITCDKLGHGDVYAQFLNDCIVISEDECLGEYDMIQCYEDWYERMHLCDGEARGTKYLTSNLERLTGVEQSDKGNWWGLFWIDGCDEDHYTSRPYY